MKNRIDFGLNTLEKNPRQNSELDGAAAIFDCVFSFDCQVSQARYRR